MACGSGATVSDVKIRERAFYECMDRMRVKIRPGQRDQWSDLSTECAEVAYRVSQVPKGR
jgi:hypothetical protein